MAKTEGTVGSPARMTNHGTVLIVDPSPEDRAQIRTALRAAGWDTVEAESRYSTLAQFDRGDIVAVTLAVKLDSESGYDVCNAIRSRSTVPIIFVTSRRDDFDHVFALNLGGDAYITKPFNPQILVAEVAAALRRTQAQNPTHVVQLGPVTVDHGGRRVTIDGREVPLSKTEFDLLASLIESPGRAYPRQTLLDHVWGPWFSDMHVVEVTIGRLRKKLAACGAPPLIGTVPGVGYRILQQGNLVDL